MNISFLKGRHPRALRLGFSLPEVTIAVAIAALGLVSILGLLPTGLENVRQAGSNIATARICQDMLAELQASEWGTSSGGTGANVTNWSQLKNLSNARRYYDGEGTPVGGSLTGELNADKAMVVSYIAKYEFVPLQANQILSGAGSAVDSNTRTDMLRVIIHIATTPNTNYDFSTPVKDHVDRAFTVTRQN